MSLQTNNGLKHKQYQILKFDGNKSKFIFKIEERKIWNNKNFKKPSFKYYGIACFPILQDSEMFQDMEIPVQFFAPHDLEVQLFPLTSTSKKNKWYIIDYLGHEFTEFEQYENSDKKGYLKHIFGPIKEYKEPTKKSKEELKKINENKQKEMEKKAEKELEKEEQSDSELAEIYEDIQQNA